MSDRPGRVGRTKGALLVVDDLFGVPGGAGGLQQRVRVRLADDRRVCGQPLDSLVSGGDAVPRGRESVGEVGDQLGGTCVVDGLVGELFELAAGLVVAGRDRVVPGAGLPGGTEPGGLVGVFGGGQPLGVLVEREGDLRHGGRVGDRAAS